MSQRLYIGKSPDVQGYYDCIIKEYSADIDNLLKEKWISYKDGWYLKPWKIIIEDLDLFIKIEPHILKLISSLECKYPQDIWLFYYRGKDIAHPSDEELENFIEENKDVKTS